MDEMAGARLPDMEERREPSSHFHHAPNRKDVSGNQEEILRSRFEAFHRNYSQFDYPPRESGRKHTALIATGTFLLMLISALAVAAWMDPALVPESASLLRTAGVAVGLVRPAGPGKGTGEQFGISREELPYDGNAMPDTAAGLAASSPTEAPSSGNSAMPEHDAGADPSLGTDTASASSGTASDLVKAEQIAPNVSLDPTSVLDTETKPKSSVKPHPKQAAVSPEARKREISRLRRQAEDELYAE